MTPPKMNIVLVPLTLATAMSNFTKSRRTTLKSATAGHSEAKASFLGCDASLKKTNVVKWETNLRELSQPHEVLEESRNKEILI